MQKAIITKLEDIESAGKPICEWAAEAPKSRCAIVLAAELDGESDIDVSIRFAGQGGVLIKGISGAMTIKPDFGMLVRVAASGILKMEEQN